MRHTRFVPDEAMPDIRPGDVVRLEHGALTYVVERVARTSSYTAATLRPVDALTASGKPRARTSRRTDQLVLVERPADSQPLSEIPWDQRDLDRQLVLLERDEQRRRIDAARVAARLERLGASGVQVEPRDAGRVDGGRACARLTQWRNGNDTVTRLEYEDTLPADTLLRLVKRAEDALDDFAANVGEYAAWSTSPRGEPRRGIAWGTGSQV